MIHKLKFMIGLGCGLALVLVLILVPDLRPTVAQQRQQHFSLLKQSWLDCCSCPSLWTTEWSGACNREFHQGQHMTKLWGSNPHENTWSMIYGKILPPPSPVTQCENSYYHQPIYILEKTFDMIWHRHIPSQAGKRFSYRRSISLGSQRTWRRLYWEPWIAATITIKTNYRENSMKIKHCGINIDKNIRCVPTTSVFPAVLFSRSM